MSRAAAVPLLTDENAQVRELAAICLLRAT